MILGRFCCLQKRPECADKTTDAPEGITGEGRYVPTAGTRLQGPAASCQTVWRWARTILGPGPRRFIISCVRGLLFLFILLLGAPSRLVGAQSDTLQCKAERCPFTAALCNSLCVHVQLLNMRPLDIFIFGRGELGDGDTANSLLFA